MAVRLDWFSFYVIICKYYVNKRLLEKQHQAEGLAFLNILNNTLITFAFFRVGGRIFLFRFIFSAFPFLNSFRQRTIIEQKTRVGHDAELLTKVSTVSSSPKSSSTGSASIMRNCSTFVKKLV